MAQNEWWKNDAPVEKSSGDDWWKSDSPVDPPKPRTRGAFEAVNDTVIEGANAAAGAVSSLANMVRPGNSVSSFIDENIIRAGEAKQSDVVRAEKQAMSQGIQDADGIGGELKAVGKYALNNPLLAAAQAAGSFVVPGAAAKTLGVIGGIGAGAALAGGDAAGSAYDLSSKAGATDEQALSAGRQASVIPSIVGGVTGAFGAERLLAGGKGFGGGLVSRALKTGASEAGQEAIEEGVTQFEGQRAAMPYDASIDPMKGVAGAAGMGAILGGATGAGVSLATGNRNAQLAPVEPQTIDPIDAPDAGIAPIKPSEAMGLDPAAGPLSRAAATAVDSGATIQPEIVNAQQTQVDPAVAQEADGTALQTRESVLPVADQEGIDGGPDYQSRNGSGIAQEPAGSTQPDLTPDLVTLESRSIDELRQSLRNAQDPAIRKTVAAEIRRRREAMPDPLQQQETTLEPQAVETQQEQPKESQAPAAATAVLGQSFTDANVLDRGSDPLQSFIESENNVRRANEGLRSPAATSSGQRSNQPGASIGTAVAGVRDGGNDTTDAKPVANSDAGSGTGSSGTGVSALTERPARWRQNALQAGKVARQLGLDPKGKRLAEIVAEIDAKNAAPTDAPNNVTSLTDRIRAKVRDAAMEKATRQEIESQLEELNTLGKQNRVTMDDLARLQEITTTNTDRYNASRDLHKLLKTIRTRAAGNIQTETPANVQNAPQAANDGQAKAAPVEASTADRGDAASNGAVSAAPGAGNVQADGVKTIAQLRKAVDDAPLITQQHIDAIRALRKAVAKDAETALSQGVVPVYVSTTGVTLAITPSAQRSGMVQVTRYNKTGAIGDSQYKSVAEAIEDNQIDEDRLPANEAEAHMQKLVEAEAEYQQSRKERTEAKAPAPEPEKPAPAPTKKPVDRAASLRKAEWKKNPLRSFLGQHGLSIDLAKEFAPGITERRKAMVGGYGPIFRKSGKNIDLLAEIAREEGFISADQDATDLYELVAAVFRGERVAPMFTADAAQDEMQARMDAMQEQSNAEFEDFIGMESADPFGPLNDDEIAATGYDAADDKIKAEVDSLIAMADSLGIDTETIREDAARETAEQSEQVYYVQARRILTQAIAQSTGSSGNNPVGETRQGQREEAKPRSNADRGTGTGSTGEQSGLTAPTRKDIEAQQARTEQTDKLDERAQIKRESEAGDTSFMTGFSEDGRQDTTGDIFGGVTQEELAPVRQSIESMRRDLVDLENKIVGVAGMAPGFIEDAMRSRKVPAQLKQQRNDLREKMREERERVQSAQPKAEKPQDAQFSVADAKRKKKGITAEQYDQNLSAWSNGGEKVLADKADEYAFKSGQPVLLESFHGTGRGDRVGTKFLKKRATSGPMSFFTSSPELASGYAAGKQDTSLYNEDNNYANWFKYQPKGQRSPVPLDRAWYSLDEATKQRISELMPDIRTDDDGNVIYEAGGGDIGSYQWNLKQTQKSYDMRGNPLAAAIETWLMSGSMFGEEQDFMKVLKLAGVPVSDITYDNPSETFPFVYKTWVRMNSPLVTSDVPVRVEQALKAAALKDRSRAQQGGADTWDKNTRTLRDWVKEYFEPSNGDNKFVWTSIPDKVTDVLRSEGYDGIIDWSGKAGGATHPVYIPFEQNQVKSAIGNNGKFDNNKDDIMMSILGESAQADSTYTEAPQAHQKAATAFAERLSKNRDSFVLMDAVKPSGARAKEAQSVSDLAKTMFGREVVFVKFKGRPLFNGAVSTTDPGKVFVNIESARPMMAVLGHELLHELRKSNPAAYNQLAKTLKTVTKDDYIYEALLKQKYRDQGLNWTPQDISEELYGDIVGDNFMDPKFWEAIAGDKPILAKQLYRAVMNWLDKIAAMFKRVKVRSDGSMVLTLAEQADGSRPFGTQKYLQDIEAARAAVAQAMGKFKNGGRGKDALAIADRQDQTETPAFKRWFGESKVVDSAGKPLRVFHGTQAEFSTFETGRNKVKDEIGIFFSPRPDIASAYSGYDENFPSEKIGSIIPVYLKINNPKIVDFKGEKTGRGDAIRAAQLEGYDGVILKNHYDAGGIQDQYVVFNPTQIKSATGNRGTFDPSNPDIRFSIADAVEQIKQFDVKTAPKNTWAHYRGMAMQALGRRQIVDLYAEELPQLEHYNDLVQRMDAEKNESGAEADNLAQEWGKLKNGEDRKLAELMHDATLAQMDPSKAQEPGTNTVQYKALESRYKALTPDAKALFGKARDMYKAHYTAVQKAIKERIERSEMSDGQKRQIMAKMDEELFKELKGVYFPLARFGQYVIVVKDANGEVKNVTRSETVKEAEAARKELQKAFPAHMGNTVGKVLKQAEFNAGRDAVGKGFMADLMGALDNKGVDDELRDTVAQLYLSSLPDLSWAKHGIHRKGTPGFSQDARRAFAQNMFHGARYLAKLRYADQLQDQLIAMQGHIKAYEGVEEYDSIQSQQVVDEMVKRHEFMMNPKSSPVSTALTSFGFLFHMGLSPASAAVNLTQTALVAFPQMGAKWGFSKASSALIKASEEVVRAKNDLSKVLKGDELEALNQAIKDGTIDVTMAHDLAGISQGEDQGVMWKVRPVMRAASFMFHHAEKFNRQATFLAAYRLAKSTPDGATKPFRQLYEEAQKATYDGHFDYSIGNRPRFMQGNWQKVIFLFKQYSTNMLYTLSRNAYQSVKSLDPKERTQARKTLAGLLAAHAAAAGVLGLPVVGQILTIASWIGGDDDEPWDAEVAMQNAMAEMLGPKAAEVMARGFSRLTPFDLSGRVALNKLILPDVQEGLEGKEWAESAMAAALGPVAGIGVNVARGMQKITEGDYMRGIEDMLPTALRGPIKALRYANEGAIDKTGIVITDEVSAAGVLGQASGFSPSQVRRDTERRSAIYGYDRALLERRSVLMRMFAEARIQGDNETVQEVQADIQKFNEKHPNRRITGMNLAQSIRNRRKRVAEAEQGVYLPSKRRDAIDAVSF